MTAGKWTPNRIVGAIVLVISLVVFFSTIAPTTSFWDCGEFIACSYTLSVPHPPGAPFYMLLGRLASMVMPFADIGYRVNSLSALLSAFAVLLTYLIIVRLTRRWVGKEQTVADMATIYGSGVVGALGLAFSYSFWWNAVEAEVYAISLFFTALVFWLAVRWSDESEKRDSTRYLLLIAYFIGLATGVHLLNILALSPIVMLIYFQKYKFSWRGFIIALIVSFISIGVVYPGIIGLIPKLLESGLFALIVFLGVVVGAFVLALRYRKSVASVVLASVLLVVIGYSTYAVIYIRANQHPVINENNPDTVERLISYLNREQYGSIGPVQVQDASSASYNRLRQTGAKFIPLSGNKILRFSILERKAPFWDYQINRMYIRYLAWQFFIGEKGQLFIAPFVLGLLGMMWHFWRDWKRASVVMLLFLMTGLAVVFYLNQENPQPRERDYAYVGSFFAFAIWVGMGAAALVEFVTDFFRKSSPALRSGVTWAVVVLTFFAVPVNMLAQNYDSHDRTGNYVAWDYSRNMLESCEPNAIIFTNGDNDTFPVWYLQVVEKVRTDVRVVNLSLLNTSWYIKQLRDEEPRVPIAFSDRDIDQRLTGRTDQALLLRYWPKGRREWHLPSPEGGLDWTVPATMYIPTGLPNETPGEPNFLRVQDIMILHIIEQNRWKRPIYFAVTVSQTNMLDLNPWLSMEGLVFKLNPGKIEPVDRERMRQNLFETYASNYRNLNNPDVYYFDNVITLLQNYRSGFLQLAFSFYNDSQRQGGVGIKGSSGIPEEQWYERFDELTPAEKAKATLKKMDEVITPEAVPVTNPTIALQVGRLYAELGDKASSAKYFNHAYMLAKEDGDSENQLRTAYFMLQHGGDSARSYDMIRETLDQKNLPVEAMFSAALIYERFGDTTMVTNVLNRLDAINGLTTREQLDLANLHYRTMSLDAAEQIYLSILEESPRNPEVYGGLVNVYEAREDTAALLNTLDAWLKINPNDQEAQKLRSQFSMNR